MSKNPCREDLSDERLVGESVINLRSLCARWELRIEGHREDLVARLQDHRDRLQRRDDTWGGWPPSPQQVYAAVECLGPEDVAVLLLAAGMEYATARGEDTTLLGMEDAGEMVGVVVIARGPSARRLSELMATEFPTTAGLPSAAPVASPEGER